MKENETLLMANLNANLHHGVFHNQIRHTVAGQKHNTQPVSRANIHYVHVLTIKTKFQFMVFSLISTSSKTIKTNTVNDDRNQMGFPLKTSREMFK